MHSFTKLLYSAFIGLALVGLLGAGVFTFYPENESKDCYERTYEVSEDKPDVEPEYNYEEERACYEEQEIGRNIRERNIAIAGAIYTILLLGALKLTRNNKKVAPVVRDGIGAGVLFSGIHTFTYAGAAENRILLFVIAVAAVVVTVLVAQERFGQEK